MRKDIFDESKIIKKDNNTGNNQNMPIENVKINENSIIDKSTPEVENNIPDIQKTSQDKYIENIKFNIEKQRNTSNIYNISTNVDNSPLFVFNRNKYTKEINSYSMKNDSYINLDVPKENIKIKLANTINYIYDLKIDIEILNFMLSNNYDNSMFDFYSEKLDNYIKEYNYCLIKKDILEKIIKPR